MKSYEEFTKEIAETINNRREELFPNFKNVTVELNEVTKSNDEAHIGLVIRKEGSNMAPNIYLEDYYSDFQSGDTMEEIISRIVDVRILNDVDGIDIENYTNLSLVRDKISCKLLNAKANELYLADKPHTKFLDLVVMYVVNISKTMTMPITNDVLEKFGITKPTLHKIAMKNLAESANKIESLQDVLKHLVGEDNDLASEDTGVTVLTNNESKFGANLILDKGVMEAVSKRMGGDFIIIPSSIHEVLIMPMSFGTEGLTDMIRTVNASSVDPVDVLSDHPYVYSTETKKVKAVA